MGISINKNSIMGEINIVPLVDVMLVLLIIFMVTAPMMVQGLDINLPKVSAPILKENEETLLITINKEGHFFLDEIFISEDFLVSKLTNIITCNPKIKIYLRADKDVFYGSVVKLIADLHKIGVSNLGIVTESEKVDLSKKKK